MTHKEAKQKTLKNRKIKKISKKDVMNIIDANDKPPVIKSYKKLHSNYAINFSGIKFFIINDKEFLEKVSKQEEQLEIDTVKEHVASQRGKKKRWLSFLFFMINIVVIVVVLVVQLSQDNLDNLGDLNVNWWYLLAAAAMMLAWIIIDQIRFMILTKKAIGIARPHLSFKVSTFGRYYDIITPFGSGGQPFQIFYLNKYGVNGGASVSITMSKYIFSQIAYFILATILLFGNFGSAVSGATGVLEGLTYVLCWVGYGVLLVLIVVVLLFSLKKRLGAGLVNWCLKVFCKIFRRDYNKLFKKTMRTVYTWQTTMKKYSKSPLIWISMLATSIGATLVQWMIPYFIYCAFVGPNPSLIVTMITLVAMTDLACMVNPIPGGAGVSEVAFTVLFGSLMGGTVVWAMIIWKILTYYFYIALGLGVISYDFVWGNKKLEKYKEKWMQPRIKFKRKSLD